eukprot:gene5071-7076_t
MGCSQSKSKEVVSKDQSANINSKPAEAAAEVTDTPPALNANPTSDNVFAERETPKLACFGAGCYWGTEKFFFHSFHKVGKSGKILEGKVGFMGPEGAIQNPNYREVCSGETGHVEVYHFEYVGGPKYYEEIVRYFFQFHDPTTLNSQGNDTGTQYASVIYCVDQEQIDIATKVKNELQALMNSKTLATGYIANTITTDIRKYTRFYPAHEEHQDYLTQNPNGYCNHRIRFKQWPAAIN